MNRKQTVLDALGHRAGRVAVDSTVHNIQARTPAENVVAMLKAVRAFNAGL